MYNIHPIMKTKTIRQTINLKAKPFEVFDMIMDSKKHGEITNADTSMSRKIKGKFSVYGGYATGYNMELVEGEKIIQAWKFDEDGWPEDHHSICCFHFEKTAHGTRLVFEQSGVPEHKFEALKKGWHEYYWSPMKKFIEDHKHIL